MSILPRSTSGKWSLGLSLSSVVMGVAGRYISDITENTIEYPNPLNSPLLGTVIYLTFAFIIAASILGLRAIIKKQERSILVILFTSIGVLMSIGGLMLAIGGLVGSWFGLE